MAPAARNARITRKKHRPSASPPPALKKRRAPGRIAVRSNGSVSGGLGSHNAPGEQRLNPLPLEPPHERPSWQVFGWGAGDSGQLGMGAQVLSVNLVKPRRNHHLEGLANTGAFGDSEAGFESLAAGALHSLFIDEKGTVWTCGTNDNAELGRTTVTITEGNTTVEVDEATSDPFHIPVPIQSLVDEGFRAIKVAVGDCIGAVLDVHGHVRAWGTYRTSNGELGFAPNILKQYKPVSIPATAGLEFSSIAAGDNHLLLLTTDGQVYSAGSSEYMQLGRRVLKRHMVQGTIPERVILQTRSRRAVAVGVGADHSFAVDTEGTVWGWGLNGHGQTGTGVKSHKGDGRVIPSPLRVQGLSKDELGGATTVVQIAGGAQHTLFLTSDGRVYACGNHQDGQLGLPDDRGALVTQYPSGYIAHPVLVPFPDADDPVVAVACGTHNSLAITQGGAMYGWGRDTTGQVGTNSGGADVRTPTNIVRKTGGSWAAKAVSCGSQHSLALLQKRT